MPFFYARRFGEQERGLIINFAKGEYYFDQNMSRQISMPLRQ
jgi:hypothetical protein